jgi:hypothetical protein
VSRCLLCFRRLRGQGAKPRGVPATMTGGGGGSPTAHG